MNGKAPVGKAPAGANPLVYVRYRRSASGSVAIKAGTVSVVDLTAAHALEVAGWATRCDVFGDPIPCDATTFRCATARDYKFDASPCCKSHVFRILSDLDKLFKKHDVTWWMDYGTLLGARRHKGMIPWDKDGDIGVLGEDWGKIWQAIDELTQYDIVKKERRPKEFGAGNSIKVRLSIHNHTNVDIFPWYEREDGTMYRVNYVSIDRNKGREFHKSKLYPLKRIQYEEARFPAPRDVDWFLTHRYGDWQTPIRRNNDGVRR
jgi:hypothetical protein